MYNKGFSGIFIIALVAVVVLIAVVIFILQNKQNLEKQPFTSEKSAPQTLEEIQQRVDEINLGDIDTQFNSVDQDLKKLEN